MATWLRIAGIAFNAIGSMILAFRIKGILDVLVTAQEANDLNFRLLIEIIGSKPQTNPLIVGMNEQVTRKQKASIWLLVAGFGCLAFGNILIGASWYLEAA